MDGNLKEKSAMNIEYGVCPEPEHEDEMFEITADIEVFPGEPHVREKVLINRRTGTYEIIDILIKRRAIRNGKYQVLGVEPRSTEFQPDHKVGVLSQYLEYLPGDVIFYKREITQQEIEAAHFDYIVKRYSENEGRMPEKHSVRIELRNVGLMSDYNANSHFYKKPRFIAYLHTRKRRIIQVKAFAMQNRHDIYYLVRQKGYDAGEFIFWPKVKIPFEDWEISTDALVGEIGENMIVMGPQIYR